MIFSVFGLPGLPVFFCGGEGTFFDVAIRWQPGLCAGFFYGYAGMDARWAEWAGLMRMRRGCCWHVWDENEAVKGCEDV